jgi:hypothetical protein
VDLAAAILVAMSALPCPRDEPAEQCQPWRATVATAIAQAAEEATCTDQPEGCKRVYPGSREELAALLLVTGYRESGLRQRIARGECRKLECDHYIDKYGVRRYAALGLFQEHRSPWETRAAWRAMAGDTAEHVTLQARRAAKLLGRGRAACGSVQGAMAHYGGAGCLWSGTGKRAREQAKIERQIRSAQ